MDCLTHLQSGPREYSPIENMRVAALAIERQSFYGCDAIEKENFLFAALESRL